MFVVERKYKRDGEGKVVSCEWCVDQRKWVGERERGNFLQKRCVSSRGATSLVEISSLLKRYLKDVFVTMRGCHVEGFKWKIF